jgi:hypothetical protein
VPSFKAVTRPLLTVATSSFVDDQDISGLSPKLFGVAVNASELPGVNESSVLLSEIDGSLAFELVFLTLATAQKFAPVSLSAFFVSLML